jgi:hypothetical protein
MDKVKLLKPWGNFSEGDTVEVPEYKANRLIVSGQAEKAGAVKKAKPAKSVEDSSKE